MGLFSGSFGTGLVTGLATSVNKSLRSAMDKRNEEMSRARQFWQTRQAQKLDLAEARDNRIKKSLNRLIDEMDGNVAGGLAAYKAAGGDPDSVEMFIKDLDETRAANLEYNLKDKLKLDGIDLSEFGDLTRDRAFASVRTELSPVDMQMKDMSGLANIGLGMKDMGKGISESVNEMIPAREQEAIEGITGAVLDRSGMITSERYKKELMAAIPDMKKQMSANLYQINNGMDLMNRPLNEAGITNLQLKNARLVTQIGNLAKAEAAATDSGPTLTEISALYSKGLSQLQTDSGFEINPQSKLMTIVGPKGVLEGPQAAAYWKKIKNEWMSDFVKTSIFDNSGNYVSSDADFAARGLGLGNVASSVRESLVQAQPAEDTTPPAASTKDAAATKTKAPKTAAEAGFATVKDINRDPLGYITAVRANNPSITNDQLISALVQSGMSEYVADTYVSFNPSSLTKKEQEQAEVSMRLQQIVEERRKAGLR